ncbi:matrix metalloproteinase-18-like [Amphiura filiformis]|uniref:matrix metalloproteinase-18-like n=1 Tax=Amphiura filiformis TaxID=82378 RepID=UPI003B225051
MQGSSNLGLILSLLWCVLLVHGMPSFPRSVLDADDAMTYLQRFNHMGTPNMQTGQMMTEDDMVAAISSFQSMANITVTGKLNNETMDMMNMPRCGMPDNMGFSNAARRKRYAAMARWDVTDITWRINSYSTDLPEADINRIMADSLKLWSDVSGLTFTESTAADADFIIDFNTGAHGDGNPFDGPGSVLAHAYFPTTNPIGGDAHFDDDEGFTQNTDAGIDLFQVAAHEFGHSLGLGHSDDPNALMYAFYRGYIPNFVLPEDDINGIQYLYGENTGAADPTMRPFTVDPNSPCPGQLDTIARTGDGRTFAFIGNLVYQILNDGVATGYPQLISQVFADLPNDIDASFYWPGNGRTYFFKGAQYYRYSDTTPDAGYPLDISLWGLPADIDAAFVWSGNGRLYFVKGDQYYRYNTYTGRIDNGYPRPLSVWGLPVDSIDAAMQFSNSRTYFFAGDNYYRYNDASFEVDASYPRLTAYWWFGCGENNLEDEDDGTGGSLASCLPNTLALVMSLVIFAFFQHF